jgi:carboxyl-terminal processing protease
MNRIAKNISSVFILSALIFSSGAFLSTAFAQEETSTPGAERGIEEIALHDSLKLPEQSDWLVYSRIIRGILQLISEESLYEVDIEKCAFSMFKALSGRELPNTESNEEIEENNDSEGSYSDSVGAKKFVCLDEHSAVMLPKAAKNLNEVTRGDFVGIGITIVLKDINGVKSVMVDSLIDGGPADESGILAGDAIIGTRNENENEFTEINTLRQAVSKLRGPKDTIVVVRVKRQNEVIDISVARRKVDIQTITHAKRINDTTGYVRLVFFSDKSADQLEEAVHALNLSGHNPKLIIDLRGNPGGALSSAMELLFYFSNNPEDIIYTIRQRNKPDDVTTIGSSSGKLLYPDTLEVKAPGVFAHYSIAVLINKYSASASEIFAGTLKDWGSESGRFFVVGNSSYGKGVGQQIFNLERGVALKLTTFEFLVGNSKSSVNEVGVGPNFEIENTVRGIDDVATPQDAQYMKALEELRALNSTMSDGVVPHRGRLIVPKECVLEESVYEHAKSQAGKYVELLIMVMREGRASQQTIDDYAMYNKNPEAFKEIFVEKYIALYMKRILGRYFVVDAPNTCPNGLEPVGSITLD